ncbi:MAG: DUF2851 family protein [Akkermansia sp.]|nr:DUF2851 family protein [Akkermansia sp.]
MPDSRRRAADAYGRLLHDVYAYPAAAAEEEAEPPHITEMELQALWAAGMLGQGGQTRGHGAVRILDFGTWNRSAGPDFLNAEIELDGVRRRGDIELDPTAQDWENHGHGANPGFNKVVLHVVFREPPAGWYTRNSLHREVPVLSIPAEVWQKATGMPLRRDTADVELCREPLAAMQAAEIAALLQAAAAHRLEKKRHLFRAKAECLGVRQAWFEAWAETLGYSANKVAMQMLARRAPLKELGQQAESILFGTAGFLVPVLPERASDEARAYHRRVWDSWWALREQFELANPHNLPWTLSPVRPLNHPQRRVAALAESALHWQQIEPHLNAAGAKRLAQVLGGISHPYWDTHCTLPSAPLARKNALVGRQRISDFLINHVYAQDDSAAAWHSYLALPGGPMATRIKETAARLFGEREDLGSLLSQSYAQQALLQIEADFCAAQPCAECLFPRQLCQWKKG